MKNVLLFCGVVFMSLNLLAQDTRMFTFEISVNDKTSQEALDVYIVDVYEGNKIIQSPEIGKKGVFETHLFGSGEYTIDISLNGYFPKRILVKTNVPKDIKKLKPLKFEVELIRKSEYEEIDKVDAFATSVFDMPYVIFEYDKSIEDFNYRKSYTDHIKEKYAEVSD